MRDATAPRRSSSCRSSCATASPGFELEPRQAVGGVVLLDERWRRRVVGLVGESAAQAPQPLLSELYYVERALAPAPRCAAARSPS